MKPRLFLLLGAMAALVASPAPPASAQTGTGLSALYQLAPDAAFVTGCFPPCLCPVLLTSKMEGTFRLRQLSVDPLFTTYEVSDVQWSLPGAATPVEIRGSGTYRVGGEFAAQQELALDLTLNSSAPIHFDSGLVLGGGGFPAIDVRASLHQEMACTDSVLVVKANPVTATSTGGDPFGAGLSRVSVVSPFHGATSVRLDFARPGRVDIDVFDTRGRLVRRLARDRAASAGASAVAWDGLDDRGRSVAAGLYVIRVRSEGRTFVCRGVKIK